MEARGKAFIVNDNDSSSNSDRRSSSDGCEVTQVVEAGVTVTRRACALTLDMVVVSLHADLNSLVQLKGPTAGIYFTLANFIVVYFLSVLV